MGRFQNYKSACFACVFWENRKKLRGKFFFCCCVDLIFFPCFASEISFFNIRSIFCPLLRGVKYCCFQNWHFVSSILLLQYFLKIGGKKYLKQTLKNIPKLWTDVLKFRSFRSTEICTIGTLPVHFLYRNHAQLFLPE